MPMISLGSTPIFPRELPVRHVGMIVFDGTFLEDVAAAMEVLHRCNALVTAQSSSLPRYVTSILSCGGGIVTSSGTVPILTEVIGQKTRDYESLLVASGNNNFVRHRDPVLIDFLQSSKSQARRIAGICTGVFALAEAGLLNDRRATTHAALQRKLAADFPKVKLQPHDVMTRDLGICTTRDAGSAQDLALGWVEADFGSTMAAAVFESLKEDPLYFAARSELSLPVSGKKQAPNKMREASQWMLEHLGEEIDLSAAAESACMSQRNFLRQFKREFDLTPSEFLMRARLDMARHELCATDLPVDKIGRRCGLGNGVQVSKLFRKYMALTPVEYRQRNQLTSQTLI